MRNAEYDVIIIGAGAAGLSCAHQLIQKGLKVLILEAQSRIGGRIRTYRESGLQTPLELGAEFIHGRPDSTFDYMNAFGIPYYDGCDNHLFLNEGKLQPFPNFWDRLDQIIKQLNPNRKTDRSIQQFLESLPNKDSKTLEAFVSFIEGFHAADIHQLSEKGLAQNEQVDEEELNQSAMFRIPGGYDQLIQGIYHSFPPHQEYLRLNCIVKKVKWKKNSVTISSQSSAGLPLPPLNCQSLVITIPLGVLKEPATSFAAIDFDPLPENLENALSGVQMGDVQRITFHFRKRFWDEFSKEPVGFLHAGPEKYFPTWWTMMPMRTPLLVAWQGGPKAKEMASWSEEERIKTALLTLTEMSGKSLSFLSEQLQSWATHNWTMDPFFRGAYSYILAGGSEKAKRLARPFEETLYFAGEATALDSTRGTVNGALESGMRAARQILKKHAMQEMPLTL